MEGYQEEALPVVFSPADIDAIEDGLSIIELDETLDALSGEPEIPVRVRSSDDPPVNPERDAHAEAALLCLREGDVQTVEEYFIGTGLVDSIDIRQALDRAKQVKN